MQGGKAAANGTITWEGGTVTTANKNGGFKFSGVVPADCVGTLSDGVLTIDVVVLDCTPVAAARAPVPRTGQTTSYVAGDDGALQKGVALPTPRFTDNSNGTITDNLTGLIWLKNANCPGTARNWQTALNDVASLNSFGSMNGNNCGDTSNTGNHQTGWRLPNIRELPSLLNYAFWGPALSNAAGTGQATTSDPFSNWPAANGPRYWSSTTVATGNPLGEAFIIYLDLGFVEQAAKVGIAVYYVLPVSCRRTISRRTANSAVIGFRRSAR